MKMDTAEERNGSVLLFVEERNQTDGTKRNKRNERDKNHIGYMCAHLSLDILYVSII